MKKCQFCAEEIQDAAIVCKHCNRDSMVSLTKIQEVIQPYLLANYKITTLTNTSATLVFYEKTDIKGLMIMTLFVSCLFSFWSSFQLFPFYLMGISFLLGIESFLTLAKKSTSVLFHVFPDGQVVISGYTLDVLQQTQQITEKAMNVVQQRQKNIHEKGMLRFIVVPIIVWGLIVSIFTMFIFYEDKGFGSDFIAPIIVWAILWFLGVLLPISGWIDNERQYRKTIGKNNV